MLYSNVGNLSSARIILGSDGFGDRVPEAKARDIMSAYADKGGNHIDTARIYGGGECEGVVGRWLKSQKRESIIISTKGAHPPIDRMDISRLSLAEIESDLDKSLSKLGTDYIDLYWLHRDDERVDACEITEHMNLLVKKGKIRNFGASNWRAQRITEANAYAQSRGLMPFCASQIRFSPARTSPEFTGDTTLVEMDAEQFEIYSKSAVAVMAFASQAKGFFSKLLSLGADGLSKKARERYYCEENVKKAVSVDALARKYKVGAAAVVCASLASIDAFKVFPVIGSKSVEQLEDSLKGADLILSPEELKGIIEFI